MTRTGSQNEKGGRHGSFTGQGSSPTFSITYSNPFQVTLSSPVLGTQNNSKVDEWDGSLIRRTGRRVWFSNRGLKEGNEAIQRP